MQNSQATKSTGGPKDFRVLLAVLLAVSGLAPAAARGDEKTPALEAVQSELIRAVEIAEPSLAVVAVFVSTPEMPSIGNADDKTDLFEKALSFEKSAIVPARMGSGVLLKIDESARIGYLLTDAHVLEPAVRGLGTGATAQIAVRFAERWTCSGAIHALDPWSGLAVLRVDLATIPQESALRAAPLGTAEDLKKGSLTLTFCDPWELARSGSAPARLGMVSNRGQSLGRSQTGGEGRISDLNLWMQLDLPASAGAGGAVVFDLQGRVVGFSSSVNVPESQAGAGLFLLPCNAPVRKIIAQLLQGFEVEYGDLGLKLGTESTQGISSATNHHRRGSLVRVQRVIENSPAMRAGVKPADLIKEVNGQPVNSVADVLAQTAFLDPGTMVELKVSHAGSQADEEVRFRLGKMPVAAPAKQVVTAHRRPDWRGLRVDFPTARIGSPDEKISRNSPQGVLVTEVLPDSPAAAAGLKVGEWIAKVGELPIETPSEFQEALKYWPQRVPLTLSDGREVLVEEPAPEPGANDESE